MQFLKRLFRKTTIALALATLVLWGADRASGAIAGVLSPEVITKHIEVPVFITPPPVSLAQLLDEIPRKYGLHPLLVRAVVAKESGGRMDAIRFEPHHLTRGKKISARKDEARMYASSLCVMQVMGWWAPEYDLKWHDLLDPETCIEVGSAILSDCMSRHKDKTPVEQVKAAGHCYNGARAYGEDLARRLGELMIEETIGG